MGSECLLSANALKIMIIRTISAYKDDIDCLEFECCIALLRAGTNLSPCPMKGDEYARDEVK